MLLVGRSRGSSASRHGGWDANKTPARPPAQLDPGWQKLARPAWISDIDLHRPAIQCGAEIQMSPRQPRETSNFGREWLIEYSPRIGSVANRSSRPCTYQRGNLTGQLACKSLGSACIATMPLSAQQTGRRMQLDEGDNA